MRDRALFLRPIAHRGLHDAHRGRIENSPAAFAAAIARSHGIECDLRAAAGGLPIVFHDATLERLVAASGPVSAVDATALRGLRYRESGEPILSYAELLELVGGRVPVLVEVKSEWSPPDHAFLAEIARLSTAYAGPVALMSFDPAVMAVLRALAPSVPRGIVSGLFKDEHGETWWRDVIDEARAYRLAHLLESAPAAPDFYAYHIKALPTPVTRFVREVLAQPLFTWTVRTAEDWQAARQWADAPIFEGTPP